MSLLHTDQKREKEHLATMLRIARDYARSKGFTGTFLIEPKPMEPSKHQYDVDTETVIGFLKAHGLCTTEGDSCVDSVLDLNCSASYYVKVGVGSSTVHVTAVTEYHDSCKAEG